MTLRIMLAAIQGAMEPVTSAWPSVVQTVFLAIIPLLAIWLNAYLKRIETKVDATKVEVDATKVVSIKNHALSNSAMTTSMEALVSACRLLVAEDPENLAYREQLETALKNLAAHKAKNEIAETGLESQPSSGESKPIVVQRVEEPVEIKTK